MEKLLDRLRVPEPDTAKLLASNGHPYAGACLAALWLIVLMLNRIGPVIIVVLLSGLR